MDYFDGELDEHVRVWDAVLTEAEANEIVAAHRSLAFVD